MKKLTGHDGAIDLFWPGNLIVEHKSLGGNLSRAQSQAFEYIHALVNEGRHKEVPRYVMVSDFARIVLYDLEPEEQRDLPLFEGRRVQLAAEFNLADLYKNIRPFAFIAGYKQQKRPRAVHGERRRLACCFQRLAGNFVPPITSHESVRRAAGRCTRAGCAPQTMHSSRSLRPDCHACCACQAHTELDRAVDRCYRKEPFPSDRARVECRFQLYEQLTAPPIAAAIAKPKRAWRTERLS